MANNQMQHPYILDIIEVTRYAGAESTAQVEFERPLSKVEKILFETALTDERKKNPGDAAQCAERVLCSFPVKGHVVNPVKHDSVMFFAPDM